MSGAVRLRRTAQIESQRRRATAQRQAAHRQRTWWHWPPVTLKVPPEVLVYGIETFAVVVNASVPPLTVVPPV